MRYGSSIATLMRRRRRIGYAAFAALCALALFGCETAPPQPVVVSGNGKCHPSQDLPAHKTLKKVPEQATGLDALFYLLGMERKSHAADIRDYNSLYDQCVDKTGVSVQEKPSGADPAP